MIAALWYHPIQIGSTTALWLLGPLLLAVAIVYKTVRTDSLRMLPLQIGLLMLYMLGGLAALSLVLWGIHTWWP